MKEEVLDIAKKLYHNHLTPETATNLILDLFAVSGRSEQVTCDNCADWKQGDEPDKYCLVCNRMVEL